MLKITEVVFETPKITTIRIDGPEIEGLAKRKAGQFARLSILRDSVWTEEHPFTISNAPEDSYIEFTIKALGQFTNKIRETTVGTEVQVKGPIGVFCKDIESHDSIIMIAGGIGITPFLSVLRHFKNNNIQKKMVLFWANNTHADIFRNDEFVEYTKSLSLKIIHVLFSEPNLPESNNALISFEKGLCTPDILEKYSDIHNQQIYLCGPPQMNDHIINLMAQMQIDKSHLQMEKIYYSSPKK